MASSSPENMMRIAIAGSGGLAQIFAYHINETSHPFIILSRSDQPELTRYGYQVVVVDYDDQTDLRFNLRGIGLVISTVSGTAQINLIDAAANSGVRRFVPSEFEGPSARRHRNDPLDRGKAAAIARLRDWTNQRRCVMRFTLFTCGVFYERFARGGLASINVGASTNGANYQGAYLMDVGQSTAEIVERNMAGRPIHVCLTSANDVARFLVAAIELGPENWPGELRMSGDRLTVSEIVQWAEAVKGGALFSTDIIEPRDLQAHLDQAIYYQDYAKVNRIQELIATEQRRYDYEQPNLNALVDVTPMSFWDWLREHWAAQ